MIPVRPLTLRVGRHYGGEAVAVLDIAGMMAGHQEGDALDGDTLVFDPEAARLIGKVLVALAKRVESEAKTTARDKRRVCRAWERRVEATPDGRLVWNRVEIKGDER